MKVYILASENRHFNFSMILSPKHSWTMEMIEMTDLEDITASENNTIFLLSSVLPSLFQNFHKAISSSVLGLYQNSDKELPLS